MNQLIEHCCEWMTLFLQDPRVAIIYAPSYRKYMLPLLQKNKHIGDTTEGFIITYCPWCASKLLDNLTDTWFEILQKEYGLNDPDSKEQQKLIPEEFKTDEWWKKRNL